MVLIGVIVKLSISNLFYCVALRVKIHNFKMIKQELDRKLFLDILTLLKII